jgi:rhodanese-related sulfurtransferase
VHCAAGYRSVIAGSLLKKQGINNVINVEGGFGAIKETAIPLSDFICPTTL